ncbi:RagB/SusD family nutrient uptake outer membrane protein [Pedobacter foliorum]|uniref:RagB/SusD family nutrient uptake outer membrane protein n=1 Tax=Pedobacter foliorum TaxID=2739058 RepID=UPI0015677A78|nr:RagB/SusD family nutrient uptake outer membrane protein [Pedobacter foliorum]NRF41125.1 RagB/SusD family nutrient uptake outer membrane protein [Pedobacter foliorum]
MKNIKLIYLISGVIICLQSSCKKFLDIDAPKDSLSAAQIFKNDEVATSAVTGIYSGMANSGYASGGNASITSVCGLSSDEFENYNSSLVEFYENELHPQNTSIGSLYALPYTHIYTVNAILEGLSASKGISATVRSQLEGEAHFVRAFCYFYLVNLFGPVPLQLNSDYRESRNNPRAPEAAVYQQIIADLETAERLLTDTYVSGERVRPNRAAAEALLARTYLYMKDWQNAEKYASLVISKSNIYDLVGLDEVFIKNSKEIIWSIFPSANTNSQEGNLFILQGTPDYVSLRTSFASTAFEPDDKRKTAWVGNYTDQTGSYDFPYKYKVKSSTTISEYSVVFRLAEQYLIRAEARARQNKLTESATDLDQIRHRAGLLPIKNTHSDINQIQLLTAIQHERQTELFAEWGHRWFDLKRSGLSTAILSPLKAGWKSTDILYPIPTDEISRNHQINQNEGY